MLLYMQNRKALSHTHLTRASRILISPSFFFRLLDVVAGRKDPAGLRQGKVLIDGKAVISELRLSSAYVVQVDKYKHTQVFFLLHYML